MIRQLRTRARWQRLSAGFLFAAVLCGASQAQSRTYTTDADFDEGVLVNVNHDVVHDQLQLDVAPPGGGTLPFVCVTTSVRGTLLRIDANTGAILGEYRTAPELLPRNPSRTSVDSQGNVWIGNRDEFGGGQGSVVKIGIVVGGTRVNQDGTPNAVGGYVKGPFQYSTCVDRDGDNLIRTSRGITDILAWPNITDGAGGADGLVDDAVDECILVFQRTTGTEIRHVSVDANDDVWVGGFPFVPTSFDLLDGGTGSIMTTFSPQCGGHGGTIGAGGIIWSTSLESGNEQVLRYDPTTATELCIPVARPHALTVDNNGCAWVAQYELGLVTKLDQSGLIVPGFPKPTMAPVGSFERSIAVTPVDNHIWVAHSEVSSVSRLDNNGNFLSLVDLGAGTQDPRGISVDANGKVWVSNYNTNTAARIDPNAGANGLGAVDLVVPLGRNARPYNFGDMTGEVALGGGPQPNGSWTVIFDSGAIREFGRISYTSSEPAGTSLGVQFRIADTAANLPNFPFQNVLNGQEFSGLFGQFVEVRVEFVRNDPSNPVSPVLFDLTIEPLEIQPEPVCKTGQRVPASLLVFPEFDNRNGVVTVLTVTNTNEDASKIIDVEFVYIGRIGHQGQTLNCNEFNATVHMTANDTVSLLTRAHNPGAQQGYVYAFAKDFYTHKAVVHNYLIGSQLMLRSIDNLEYSNNPVVYLGIGVEGSPTDRDNDGVRDLNNLEYGCSPDQLLVPRFFGQDDIFQSELVLLNLTGGTPFVATIDFLLFNDNEQAFSAQYSFQCWDKVPLLDITNGFSAEFLRYFTQQSLREVVGAEHIETGWFLMNGNNASSSATTIEDPAFLALLIERAGGVSASDLPFEIGGQTNGDLLLRGILGDTTP